MTPAKTRQTIKIRPVQPDDWSSVEVLFGRRGACAGCWCMYWRKPHAAFERDKGEGNKHELETLVIGGKAPGLLAFSEGQPVGWCAMAPRTEFPRLDNSRVLAAVDGAPVWSLPCLFVSAGHRQRGVGSKLVGAAVAWARRQGVGLLEAYPVEPNRGRYPDPFAFTGLASMFLKQGFEEVARRSPTRPIVRIQPADVKRTRAITHKRRTA